MNLFKMFKRGQKGFTLVELMVVMAIMAVLATIVVPAVTGTKGVSENAQIGGDANAVQQAAAKFNNDSTTKAWPEESFSTTGLHFYSSALTASTNTTSNVTAGTGALQYAKIDFDKVTTVRLGTGALLPVNFVPDFVPTDPASVGLVTSDNKSVYLWLLKNGTNTDAPTRTLEVYKTADGTNYIKVN